MYDRDVQTVANMLVLRTKKNKENKTNVASDKQFNNLANISEPHAKQHSTLLMTVNNILTKWKKESKLNTHLEQQLLNGIWSK